MILWTRISYSITVVLSNHRKICLKHGPISLDMLVWKDLYVFH